MSSWKGLGLLLFAALIAVAAGGVAYLYLKGTAANAGSQEATTVPVVVAAEDITFGVRLGEKQLRVERFPRTSVPDGAYASTDSIIGQTTKVFMVTGEPVLASKLSSIGGGLSVRIPETMRASSVDVNEVSGVSGFILPGDRVDVLCTIDNPPGQSAGVAVTKTILQNLEVAAAGVKTQTTKSEPIRVQSVTLIVAPKQAEDLALGMHEGRIHMVLRNPVDHEIVDVVPTNTRDVFSLAAPKETRRTPTRVIVREKKPEPPPPEPTYTVIRNGSIEKQKSPNEGGGSKP